MDKQQRQQVSINRENQNHSGFHPKTFDDDLPAWLIHLPLGLMKYIERCAREEGKTPNRIIREALNAHRSRRTRSQHHQPSLDEERSEDELKEPITLVPQLINKGTVIGLTKENGIRPHTKEYKSETLGPSLVLWQTWDAGPSQQGPCRSMLGDHEVREQQQCSADGTFIIGTLMCWYHAKKLRKDLEDTSIAYRIPKRKPQKLSIPNDAIQRKAQMDGALVYFLQAIEKPDLVKIGFTTNLPQRINQLSHAGVLEFHVLAALFFDSPESAHSHEQALHRKFNRYRKSGEWFKLTSEIRAYISQVKKFSKEE